MRGKHSISQVDEDDGHRIADTWRDCVVVCSCGWRTADRSVAEARRQWRQHAHNAATALSRPDTSPAPLSAEHAP